MAPDYSDYEARQEGRYSDIWQGIEKCVFCDLKDKYIIKKGKRAALTVNLFPYYDGHLMVIPYRHFEKFNEISHDEWSEILDLSKLGIKLMNRILKIDNVWVLFRASHGFNGGKSVSHAHLHLVPYYKNKVKWEYGELTMSPLEAARRLRGEV